MTTQLPDMERAKCTVLLVDGAAPDRRLVRQYLTLDTHRNYEIVEAALGAEALEALRERTFDCLIVDQSLADMNGLELLAAIEALDEAQRPPVVMLTAGGDVELAVTSMQSGAQNFLVKERLEPRIIGLAIDDAIKKVALQRQLAARQNELGAELTERRRIQGLLATQKRVLESVALGRTRSDILRLIATEIEARIGGSICSILLVSPDEKKLRRGAANNLPEAYNLAVESVELTPTLGSCGAAVHRRQRVVVSDIETDPLWADYRSYALEHDLRACWSTPIISPRGEVLGALAVYFRVPRSPIDHELEALDLAAYLAALTIERQRSDELLHDSRERLRLALQGGDLGVWELDIAALTIAPDEKILEFLDLDFEPDQLPLRPEQLFARIHPHDVPGMHVALKKSLRDNSLYSNTCRVVDENGVVRRYVRAMGQVQTDDDGEPVKMVGVAEDVTAESEAAAALARGEKHLRDVTDNLLCMIAVLSPEGMVHWVNETATRASQLPPEAFRGRHFADAPPWSHDPAARERIDDAFRRANAGEIVRYDTATVIEGHHIDIDFMVAPLIDESGQVTHLVASGLDVSERKRAERALRESEELSRRVLESSPDCVKILDLEGRLQNINGPGCTMLEIDNFEEFRNCPWADMWPVETQYEVLEALDKARGGTSSRFQGFCPTFHGVPKWWDVIVAPIAGANGQIVRLLATSRDISAAKLLEARRENVLKTEQAARLELERINRTKDEFLATLSHELRTPLTSIIGWMDILRRDPNLDGALRSRGYEVIERNARAQHQLIEDILDVSRIVAGQLKLKKAPISLRSLVESSIESLQHTAADKGVVISPDLSVIPLVFGDATRLQQVVWNLLSNAIKFTPEGGSIRVLLRESKGNAHLEVQDDGDGIEPGFLPHAFDRFRQADSSSTRRHSGLGLGLAIVKHLVELHGGQVRADSEGKGRGATFTVDIPLAEASEAPATPGETLPPKPQRDLEGIKALIVDDEPDVLHLVQLMLELQGARVETAYNAVTALTTLTDFTPDILITDIGMPLVDGYQLLERVRELYPDGELPFVTVALTAYSSEQDRQKALQFGFATHWSKPLTAHVIIEDIERLVKENRLLS